jgi:hypothetical protein
MTKRPTQASLNFGFLHPGRNLSVTVQYSPDVDVVRALNVKHQIRIVS